MAHISDNLKIKSNVSIQFKCYFNMAIGPTVNQNAFCNSMTFTSLIGGERNTTSEFSLILLIKVNCLLV